jgi:predicted type IV restriction endonuclease
LDVAAVLNDAVEVFKSPPPNEATTCDWVILPVLHSIGYANREVISRDADSAGKFPDYTLLQDDPEHTFYLEAKAWKVDLEDGHTNQALNYANQNGKRWVVLTNGREWRLYDNDIRGLASAKLAAEMHIQERNGAIRFLQALAKASVCAGMLPHFAADESERRNREREKQQCQQELLTRRSRLAAVLNAELKSDTSLLVTAMLEHLRGRDGLDTLITSDLTTYFTGDVAGPAAPKEPEHGDPSPEKVLVIPARDAWQDYLNFSAYLCQANRSFCLLCSWLC